ncbi:MAG: ribosome-associated protein [Acidobacteriota bacterium]|nr:ribosome-associated protein [Acidobacteriota bacterium]
MIQDEQQREETTTRASKQRVVGEDAETQVASNESKAQAGGEHTSAPREPLDEYVVAALSAADDKKALDLVVLDVHEVASFTEYFLIAGGTNTRQVQAIADGVVERLKELGRRPARVEGYSGAEWVLLDYGDFVFHVFEEKARRFYDLERLWRDAVRVELPSEIVAPTEKVSDAK